MPWPARSRAAAEAGALRQRLRAPYASRYLRTSPYTQADSMATRVAAASVNAVTQTRHRARAVSQGVAVSNSSLPTKNDAESPRRLGQMPQAIVFLGLVARMRRAPRTRGVVGRRGTPQHQVLQFCGQRDDPRALSLQQSPAAGEHPHTVVAAVLRFANGEEETEGKKRRGDAAAAGRNCLPGDCSTTFQLQRILKSKKEKQDSPAQPSPLRASAPGRSARPPRRHLFTAAA